MAVAWLAGSLVCPVPDVCAGIPSIGGGAARAVASGVLEVFTSGLALSAGWMIGHLASLAGRATDVGLARTWFSGQEAAMADLAALLTVPLAMAATIGAVARQDLRRLARVWVVGVPVAALVGLAAVQLAELALGATDAMCSVVEGAGGLHPPSAVSGGAVVRAITSGVPQMVQLLLCLLLIGAGVVVWLELLLRSAAVHVALLFTPLALAAFVWPATAAMTRRALELLSALILSKFVIVAALGLGLAALEQGGADDVVLAGAVLLLAGFAPFCLLKLAPIVESAAVAHLEGVASRPFRALSRSMTTAAWLPAHPVGRLLLSKVGGRTPVTTSDVLAPPLPERRPDYPTSPPTPPAPGGAPGRRAPDG